MQTFLPFPNMMMSVGCLDRARLGKQRVECKQILNSLLNGGGWQHHPAVKMWRGYHSALAHYGYLCCLEWISRGYEDSLLSEFAVQVTDYALPNWFGGQIHITHRSNLLRKDFDHYSQFFNDVSPDVDYYWPRSDHE